MKIISWQGMLTILGILFGILSLGLNIILLSYRVDQGITITYMEDEMKHKYTQLTDCKMLLMPSHQKIGHQGFMQIAKETGLEIINKGINEQHNKEIYIGSIFFEFSDKNDIVSIDIP